MVVAGVVVTAGWVVAGAAGVVVAPAVVATGDVVAVGVLRADGSRRWCWPDARERDRPCALAGRAVRVSVVPATTPVTTAITMRRCYGERATRWLGDRRWLGTRR